LPLVNKLSSNRIYFDSPFTPIVSNNFLTSALNFDSYKYTSVNGVAGMLQGKEEQLPAYFTNAY